jgi:hypothetical protein
MSAEFPTVKVEEGFYPRFVPAFLEHYGAESIFVRAVADSFTAALARLLESKGMLREGTAIPKLGAEEASRAVVQLIRAAPQTRQLLLQEAFGTAPPESYAAALDAVRGRSFFASWLGSLESEDYASANQKINGTSPSGDA